uniref:Uncharacterized protein n=1 Tax=Lepeophtheirus salmonis TaxID=72036 RepID=A0A0K2V3R7_LEPSM
MIIKASCLTLLISNSFLVLMNFIIYLREVLFTIQLKILHAILRKYWLKV